MSWSAKVGRVLAGLLLVAQRRELNHRKFNVGEFKRWRVGGAMVTKVVELEGEGFGEFLLPDAKSQALATIGWLHAGHVGPRGGLRLSVHSFIIEIGGRRILVDTNVGNDKRRKVPIWNKLKMPWLADLTRAGFPPETIDTVICTHLHIDHVGWNTRLDKGHWVPTFPNARYIFVRDEYEFWRARLDDPARAELFADSIEPVMAAGLVDLVAPDAEIAPGVRLVLTPGHTEHHVAVIIESNGDSAIITGDFLHHPAQLANPSWSSTFDTSPATSVATRVAWFAQIADKKMLVLGTAFPDPSAGHIRHSASGFEFEPAASL